MVKMTALIFVLLFSLGILVLYCKIKNKKKYNKIMHQLNSLAIVIDYLKDSIMTF